MGEFSQTYATVAAAPVESCFAVLVDFDDYPRWCSPITAARVLERYADGAPKRVELHLDMTIRTIRYVLEYTWDPPHGARWRMTEGDVARIVGEYRFEPAPGGGSTVTCTQEIDLGFWLPGFVRSAFERKALRDSVEEFRRAAEARARRA